MLDDRNNTSQVYCQKDALCVFKNIINYLPVLEKTYAALKRNYNL
ncbi:MAG: hypothetical protein JSS34_07075 [Proteobacteria bacterium]|nr:hypothetical protein [Pseudomonadota bacterium]